MGVNDADFSGYATKAGLVCSDGRIIMPDAFKHQDKMTVPLVWQHSHDDPKNVLGKAVLEHREDGVYAYAFFNNSPEAQHAKQLVEHGDIVSLSIYANQLKERSKQVFHGVIRELSMVLSGANPGALIDQVRIAHSDGHIDELDDEAIIYTGLELEHADAEMDEETLADILGTLSPKQVVAVNYAIGQAIDEATGVVKHADEGDNESEDAESNDEGDDPNDQSEDNESDDDNGSEDAESNDAEGSEDAESENQDNESDNESEDAESDDNTSEGTESEGENDTEGDLAHMEGTNMPRNVFDQDGTAVGSAGKTLTHDQFSTIVADAKKPGMTLQSSMLAHAAEYGIEDINLLFPDAKALANSPELNSRRMEWVDKVLGGTKHTPFANVKSVVFDITEEEARAKGYIKGSLKKDEVIKLLRRTTRPTTIYKKQRLDRDDVLDITDMDVVAFLKAEIRLMLEEELARAILIGDGRSALSEDKIKDPEGATDGVGIRSILHDHELYTVKHELAANVSPKDAVKGIIRARSKYRGTGKPTLFISDNFLTDIMLEEDKFGRPLYETEQVLADKLRVKEIVTVDLFDEEVYGNLFAIMVNLMDYSIGANKGGELTSFEDFDIDYNQHKYLQETRLSGGLTKPFSAVVITRNEGTSVTPTSPSFDGESNTITVPTVTGVVYRINDEPVTGDVVIDADTEVEATPAAGYYFPSNSTRTWSYTYTPGA